MTPGASSSKRVVLRIGPGLKRLGAVAHLADGSVTVCGFLLADRAEPAPPGMRLCHNCLEMARKTRERPERGVRREE